MSIERYKNDIYAGVLGKIIGVYLGRPVEGWPYEKIRDNFGEIYYYKNHRTGAPLIVPDDDISGTFAFIRALEDSGYDPDISARAIGNAWLNYIIENKTILWWGGLSRSTEHTAYLRLKNGIKAPESGSLKLNGQSMAEQIGAQIFIDGWALVNPGNPDRAARMAKAAASVSHDKIAVDAAVYLAAMEALAFEEKDINKLLDEGLKFVENDKLKELVAQLREQCAAAGDWHTVRDWIAENHGYEKYPGNCPMVTNHLALLMAFILGGNDFHKACMIACSAGWDTDCNSGNVGCLNGIRLGLDGFSRGIDLRKAVADRLYVVTADGGSCISDAVLEARKLIKAAAVLEKESVSQPEERLAFEFPGSVQGIRPYDRNEEEQVLCGIENTYAATKEYGCRISYAGLGPGVHASACMDTFIDLQPKGKEGTSYFEVLCSPVLYGGQEVTAVIQAPYDNNPSVEFFIEYFDEEDALQVICSRSYSLNKGCNTLKWPVPDVKGHAIYRLGITLKSSIRMDGFIIIKSLDWSGAPKEYRLGKSMELSLSLTPWTTTTAWLKTFVASADHFHPDYTTTFSISHADINGVVTTGTPDWADYSVKSRITLSQQELAGLTARARGHRRYYGAALTKGNAVIYRQEEEGRTVIAGEPFEFAIDRTYLMEFALKGDELTFYVDGVKAASGKDSSYSSGGAGFVVDSGAILADGFEVRAI
jgi:ADP-ribosylglycohydrolase